MSEQISLFDVDNAEGMNKIATNERTNERTNDKDRALFL